MSEPSNLEKMVTMLFHGMFYASYHTWRKGFTQWLGVPILQNPMDLWMFQEVIWYTKPDVVIETGTWAGGTALWFASVLEKRNPKARVITIDLQPEGKRPVTQAKHKMITFIKGDSSDPAIAAKVKAMIKKNDRVMVVLDSEHDEAHVTKELNLYSGMVTTGCYLVVCDTNLGGNPIEIGLAKGDKGPMESLRKFMKHTKDFEIDFGRERFYLTFHPNGWLKRKG